MLTSFNKNDIINLSIESADFLYLTKSPLVCVNEHTVLSIEHKLRAFLLEGKMPTGIYKRKKMSEETKKKLRLALKGKSPWNKGKKVGLFPKSIFQKGHKKGMTGKHHSEKSKIKKSIAQKGKYLGEKNHKWKGGRTKTTYGYILVYKPEHPFCTKQGYVKEHRLVMEKILGRYLTPEEIPHHKNEIKDDNRPENLRLFNNNAEHMKFHHPKGKYFIKVLQGVKG